MARNTSVSLGDHFADFIDAKVREGRYASASEVIRAGLRLLEREEKIDGLRAAIDEGIASGPAERWDRDAFLAEAHRRHGSGA